MIDQALTTDNALSTESLVQIAEQANIEHRAAVIGAHHAIECGRLLLRAKRLVQHGEWEAWLTQNFEGSTRTAQRFMSAAQKALASNATRCRISDLPIDDALRIAQGPSPRFTMPQPWQPIGAELPEVLDPNRVYQWAGDDGDLSRQMFPSAIFVWPLSDKCELPQECPANLLDRCAEGPERDGYRQYWQSIWEANERWGRQPYVRYAAFVQTPRGWESNWSRRGHSVPIVDRTATNLSRWLVKSCEVICGGQWWSAHFDQTKIDFWLESIREWEGPPSTN